MRFLSSSILLIILLLVGSSCEQTPTSLSEKEEDVINPITNINRSGKSITPEFDHPTFAVNSVTSAQKAPTTLLSHLLSITKSQEHINHIGVAITLDTQKSENSVYDFNEMVLSFPPGIVAKAEGKTRFYIYNLSNKEGNTIRRFEAIVPDVPEVEALMNRWLRSGSGKSKQDKSKKESVSSDPLIVNSSSCYEYLEGDQCTAYYPEFDMWGLCEIDICTGGGNDGGGSWPEDDGGFNDPCDDPFYNCDPGGGGSSGGDTGGDGSDIDCSGTLLPAGCEKEEEFPSLSDNDFIQNADSIPDCEQEQITPWKIDYCNSLAPTGVRLNKTNLAFDYIEERGVECAAIVNHGRNILKNGHLRFFPRPNRSWDVAGGRGIENVEDGVVLLMDEWVDNWNDKSFVVQDRNGTFINANFEFALIHEIEHAMGRAHVQGSEWVTPNSLQCSGIN